MIKQKSDDTPNEITQLNEISKRTVVVLGSKHYKEPIIKRMDSVLTENKFVPLVAFKISEMFEEHLTPRQRIFWFLSNSRFVLAEDSVPSGEMIELEYCKDLGVTTAILHDKNLPRSSWMTLDIDIHSSNFRCFEYEKDSIEETVKEAIIWAESRNKNKIDMFLEKEKEWNKKNKVFDHPEVQKAMNRIKDVL